MMRLFVAAPLTRDVQDRLGGLCTGLSRVRWVDPENMHLTLRFIGEIDEAVAEDVGAALAAIHAPAFDITLSGIGCFESRRKVHTLWAGVEASDGLSHLRDKVESSVVRAGFAPERRKFHPHVTLARLRNTPSSHVGPYVEAHNGFQAGPVGIEKFVLFQSLRGNERVHYTALAEYPLENLVGDGVG